MVWTLRIWSQKTARRAGHKLLTYMGLCRPQGVQALAVCRRWTLGMSKSVLEACSSRKASGSEGLEQNRSRKWLARSERESASRVSARGIDEDQRPNLIF
jgi:hypothetical protein